MSLRLISESYFGESESSPSNKIVEGTSENATVEMSSPTEEIRPISPNHTGRLSKGVKCSRCSVFLKDPNGLPKHMELHSEVGRPWKCSNCCSYFITKKSLRHHENTRHGRDKLFKCRICNFKSRSRSSLEKHMKIHEGTYKPWKCSHCPSFFLTTTSLRIHENQLHGRVAGHSKSWCRICKTEFKCYGFTAHMRIHEDTNRPWKCLQCPSYFLTCTTLRAHENQYHNRKPGKPRVSCEANGKELPPSRLIKQKRNVDGFRGNEVAGGISAGRPHPVVKKMMLVEPEENVVQSGMQLRHKNMNENIELRDLNRNRKPTNTRGSRTRSDLKLRQFSIPTQDTSSSWLQLLAQIQHRPCKLVLKRCDDLITITATEVLPTITGSIITCAETNGSCSKIATTDEPTSDLAPVRRKYCPYCFESFDKAGLLISHLPIHTDGKVGNGKKNCS